jgi:hypothetical protein
MNNNDSIVARAVQLSKAAGEPVLWEKYIPEAVRQLEGEAVAIREAKGVSKVFTDAELAKASMEAEALLRKRGDARCV